MHWGDEYVSLPNASQRRLAEYIRSLGVELIIGSHPHVVQPMELDYAPEDSLERTLTVYSLGNFISNMKTRDTRGGVMVMVNLIRDIFGKARVLGASYIPIFTVPASGGSNFHLIEAEMTAPEHAEPFREQFLNSLTRLLDTHNKNVNINTHNKL